MTLAVSPGWAAPLALAASLGLTRLVIALAHRRGWVAKPKADRWHSEPTALYGGAAIFGACALAWLLLFAANPAWAARKDLIGLAVGGLLIFAVGLRDDVHPLNPLLKLFAQCLAVMPFLMGVVLQGPMPLAVYVTLPLMAWCVLLTNSFNLLDNMDGLCAGTSAAVAGVLTLYAALHGQAQAAAMGGAVLCACLGFLAFNFRARGSARIFMGDCGSLFLGHTLSGLAAVSIVPSASPPPAALLLPLLVMALPLFDTTLVIARRKAEGRAISQGGKDHASHRLVYAGLSEKKAVLLLYGVSLFCGLVGLALEWANQPLALAVFAVAAAAALLAFGRYLSQFGAVLPMQAADSGTNGHRRPAEAVVARHTCESEPTRN